MAYLDNSGQDQSPSFLDQLARSLGLGGSQPPSNNPALASALAGQPVAPPGAHYAQLPGPPLLVPNGGNPPAVPPASPGPAMPIHGSVVDIPNSGAIQGPAAIPAPPGPAATASIGLPGQSAAADEDSNTADTKVAQNTGSLPAASAPSVYEQSLKARFDQQEQIYNRANAQAAAAKTPEVARIFATQAASAMAEANRINDELSASRKPGTRTLSDAELTPAEHAAGGEWQQNATGERSQVGGTAGDTTRAPNPEEQARIMASGQDPKNYEVKDGAFIRIPGTEPKAAERKELRPIGHDAFGNEQMGVFDPLTGQITPYEAPPSKSSQAALPAQIQELGLPNADSGQGDKTPAIPLPPDQQSRLAAVDPHIRSTVESILQGRLGLPKITAGRGNPLPLAITQAVLTVNPQFDANTNQNQLLARKAFNAGGSNNSPGQLILNSDSALDHFEPLVKASDALPAYGSVLGSAIYGAERATGGHIGSDYQNKVASLVSAATPASAETMKYLAGTTGGGESEREQLIRSFSDTGGTPQSRRESVKNYIDDMLAKKAELQNQWHSAMGPTAPDFPVISDTARAAVNRMGFGDLLTKYGLGGAPARQVAPTPISAPPKRGVYVPGKGIQWSP